MAPIHTPKSRHVWLVQYTMQQKGVTWAMFCSSWLPVASPESPPAAAGAAAAGAGVLLKHAV